MVFFTLLLSLVQGVHKKIRRSFCLISLALNILEGWDNIDLKGGIHISVWSTKIILFDIREYFHGLRDIKVKEGQNKIWKLVYLQFMGILEK